VTRDSEAVAVPKGLRVRRLHKAFLRYHDPANWPLLRDALQRMGRADLIGGAAHHLVPRHQPSRHETTSARERGGQSVGARRRPAGATFRTQHTGLPYPGPAPRGRRPGRL
jgi:hypothetical protein